MPTYVFNSFDDPSGPGSTEAWGINDLDHIVGSYRDATGDHGFFYDAGSGTYLTLTDPSGPQRTFARGINSSDQIVGYYLDAGSNFHAFLRNPATGNYTTIDVPRRPQALRPASTHRARSSERPVRGRHGGRESAVPFRGTGRSRR